MLAEWINFSDRKRQIVPTNDAVALSKVWINLVCLVTVVFWIPVVTGHKGRHDHHKRQEKIELMIHKDIKPWEVESGPWLNVFEEMAKEENGELDYLQGDDPGMVDWLNYPRGVTPPLKCPDVPPATNKRACDQPICVNDEDCHEAFYLCCDNGCVKSCQIGVKDSTVIDWEVQPVPQNSDGPSWLVPDEDNNEKGSCEFENMVIPNGISFQYENLPCLCENGEVTCDVHDIS